MSEQDAIFLDTNVLVYAFDRSADERRDRAMEIVENLWATGQGRISVQVLQEFYVTVTAKLAYPLAMGDARALISDLATWQVHLPHPADVLEASRLQEDYGISFWDAMIIQSARDLGCGVLYSEDFNAGQEYGGVTVRNPFGD